MKRNLKGLIKVAQLKNSNAIWAPISGSLLGGAIGALSGKTKKQRISRLLAGLLIGAGAGYGTNRLVGLVNSKNKKHHSHGNFVDYDKKDIEEVADLLRVIWSYNRSYAYDKRNLPRSISELQDGTAIGRDGHVLNPKIWRARIDSDNNDIDPYTSRSGIQWRFGQSGAYTDKNRDFHSGALFAIPSKGSIYVETPQIADLKNEFSFDKFRKGYIVPNTKRNRDLLLFGGIDIDNITKLLDGASEIHVPTL